MASSVLTAGVNRSGECSSCRLVDIYAGGGLAPGAVIGRTDKHAGDVEENPISPKDILATAFHLLGIDPESTFPDPEGRPLPLTGTGRVREELLG